MKIEKLMAYLGHEVCITLRTGEVLGGKLRQSRYSNMKFEVQGSECVRIGRTYRLVFKPVEVRELKDYGIPSDS